MKNIIISFVAAIAISAPVPAFADRAATINIVGSSTVYPFASSVAKSVV